MKIADISIGLTCDATCYGAQVLDSVHGPFAALSIDAGDHTKTGLVIRSDDADALRHLARECSALADRLDAEICDRDAKAEEAARWADEKAALSDPRNLTESGR